MSQQTPEREKLYGEFHIKGDDLPYFCFRHPRHNPWGRFYSTRYYLIRRMTKADIENVHALELKLGRDLSAFEIINASTIPAAKGTIDEYESNAIMDWLTNNMIDEIDHRCPEIPQSEAKKYKWHKTHGHLVRRFGMLHSTDWIFHKTELKIAKPPRKKSATGDVEDRDPDVRIEGKQARFFGT